MAQDISRGLSVSSDTLVQQLQNTLSHYGSDDIVRELIQNADDAEASVLHFYLIAHGDPKSPHPLLQPPALLVFNGGPIKESDAQAITQLIGGNKFKKLSSLSYRRFSIALIAAIVTVASDDIMVFV